MQNPKQSIHDIVKVINHLIAKLLEFKFFFIIIQIFSLLYFISNYQSIDMSQSLVISYSVIAFGALILMVILELHDLRENIDRALLGGKEYIRARMKRRLPIIPYLSLEKLNWKPTTPSKRLRSPRNLFWLLMAGAIAGIGTIIITLLVFGANTSVHMSQSYAINLALQQLFIITLTETVMFAGIIPLIVDNVFFKDLAKKEGKEIEFAWVGVYTISQGFFAAMHITIYGGDFFSLISAFALGWCWAFLFKRYGLMAAWFSHFGWNCVALGVV